MTISQESQTTAQVSDLSPDLLEEWLRDPDTVLIDVREDFEHASERIAGARLVPLGTVDPEALLGQHPGKRIVFHCRSGKRSGEAAQKLANAGSHAFHLAGGIEAWKAAGKPISKPQGGPQIDVMRQVQITAGSLVLTGVVLGVTVSPWFLILSGFVGAGLIFAGASGFCGMAKVLAVMPWNRADPGAA